MQHVRHGECVLLTDIDACAPQRRRRRSETAATAAAAETAASTLQPLQRGDDVFDDAFG